MEARDENLSEEVYLGEVGD